MAVVPQETQLAFDYTVAEVAMMGRYPHLGAFEIEGPADLAVIEETLTSTGTLHLKDRLFATLSGGEKQRVVIAAALAQIFRLTPRRKPLPSPKAERHGSRRNLVASAFRRKKPAISCSTSRRRRSISATSSKSRRS